MKKYSKKVMLCVFGAVILLVIAISLVFALANRTEYYECTEYTISILKLDKDGKQVYDNIDHLEEYSYYRLYLSKGKLQFKLEYKINGDDEVKTYTGYYSIYKDTNVICLDYQGKEDASIYPQEADGKAYYKIDGNKLIRVEDETGKQEGADQIKPSRQKVYQTFKKKISW